MIVHEHSAQFIISKPAFLDGLAVLQPIAASVPTLLCWVVLLREGNGAAEHKIAGFSSRQHRSIKLCLVLSKSCLLIIPTVGSTIRGQNIEVHQVNMASHHVGLHQLLVSVVAQMIRGAVRQFEIDAVSRIDSEEERLRLFRTGKNGVDVFVSDDHPALNIHPIGVVVHQGQLNHTGSIRHRSGSGGAGIDHWRSRLRFVTTVVVASHGPLDC